MLFQNTKRTCLEKKSTRYRKILQTYCASPFGFALSKDCMQPGMLARICIVTDQRAVIATLGTVTKGLKFAIRHYYRISTATKT